MNETLSKTGAIIRKKFSLLEEFVSKDKPRKALFFFAVAATFAAMCILNTLFPYWADDILYLYKWETAERVENFHDIIESQYRHYFEWGGRTIAHTILQGLLICGKTCTDLLNSIMYVVYTLAIYRIANLKTAQAYNLHLFIVINLFVWFLQLSWSDSCLWFTGSCNYLWMNTFTLLFLYPYCKLYIKKKSHKFWGYAGLLFFAGIIVGWSHENTSVAAVVFIIILFVILRRERTKIPLWAKAGFAGLLIGALILFLSPGTHLRNAMVLSAQGLNPSFIPRMLYGVYRLLYYTFMNGLPLLISVVLSFVIYKHFGKASTKRHSVLAYLFFASAFAVLITLIASAVFNLRVWFVPTSFAIVGISILLFCLDFKQKAISVFVKTAISLLVLFLSSQYFFTLKDVYRIKQVAMAREKKINEQKKQGKKDIVIVEDQLFLQAKRTSPQLLSTDSTTYYNRYYAIYHGVQSIRAEYNLK
jgi:hypothetical protein